MPDIYRETFTIEYDEPITAPLPSGHGAMTIGKRRMRAEVMVIVQSAAAASKMGPRACRSKGKRCKDGLLAVECISTPIKVSETRY